MQDDKESTVEATADHNSHLVVGVLLFMLGLSALVLTFYIENTNVTGLVGPRTFPLVLAICVMIGGAALGLQGVMGLIVRRDPKEKPPPDRKKSDEIAKVAFVIGAVLAAILVWPYVGTTMTFFTLATAVMIYMGQPWWRAIVASVIMVVVIRWLFERVFLTPLPHSTLWETFFG